jgi:magnesium-transporting ATPase (P-type)
MMYEEPTEPDLQTDRSPWHAMDKNAVIGALDCDLSLQKAGLTDKQVQDRLEKYGENKLSEKEKVTLLQRIWKQVANVLVGILVFVTIVSLIRAATAKETNIVVTNWIQVGLIVLVIS